MERKMLVRQVVAKGVGVWLVLCSLILFCAALAPAQEPKMVLTRAVMCETIEKFKPVNPAVVFPISQGEVFCFSSFDPVRAKTHIFHKWYKQDKLIFNMRLTLSPPKWSSFSRIQIREADKGPWRVEIADETGKILKTLRFSMSE